MSKVMFKKFVVKFFGLTDISDMILQGKKTQKELDERYWKERLADLRLSLNREHQLELSEKDAQISMLEDSVRGYKAREKELDSREHKMKLQVKDNSFVVTKISSAVDDLSMTISSFVGTMRGIKSEADEHKLRIEKK